MLIDYPASKHREEAHFLILKSSFELAINSISSKIEERLQNTIDAYLVFNDNYPNGKYIKQTEKIEQQTRENLNNDTMNYKKTGQSTITRDLIELRRKLQSLQFNLHNESSQINRDIKEELINKLEEFTLITTNLKRFLKTQNKCCFKILWKTT